MPPWSREPLGLPTLPLAHDRSPGRSAPRPRARSAGRRPATRPCRPPAGPARESRARAGRRRRMTDRDLARAGRCPTSSTSATPCWRRTATRPRLPRHAPPDRGARPARRARRRRGGLRPAPWPGWPRGSTTRSTTASATPRSAAPSGPRRPWPARRTPTRWRGWCGSPRPTTRRPTTRPGRRCATPTWRSWPRRRERYDAYLAGVRRDYAHLSDADFAAGRPRRAPRPGRPRAAVPHGLRPRALGARRPGEPGAGARG